jgi:hypothetical protein
VSDDPDLPADEENEPEPERGDVREDITKELARLFPDSRMQRIVDRLELATEEDVQYIIDLISATFTRGIEFGAVEVTAQQIELGHDVGRAQIEIVHVELP